MHVVAKRVICHRPVFCPVDPGSPKLHVRPQARLLVLRKCAGTGARVRVYMGAGVSVYSHNLCGREQMCKNPRSPARNPVRIHPSSTAWCMMDGAWWMAVRTYVWCVHQRPA